jgi:hypothetical protein
MKRFVVILSVLMLSVMASGPALAQGTPPTPAQLRFFHASPDAPAVNVLINGRFVFSHVTYGQSTFYKFLPAETTNVKVVTLDKNQAIVIDTDLSLKDGKEYTLAAVGMAANLEPLLIEDSTEMPAWGQSKVRAVHLSPDAPAVDVAVKDGDVLFPGVQFKGVTDFETVDSNVYDLQVLVAGTSDVALDIPWVRLNSGSATTIFVIGMATTEPALQARQMITGQMYPPRGWHSGPCCFYRPPMPCCGPGFYPPRPPAYQPMPPPPVPYYPHNNTANYHYY